MRDDDGPDYWQAQQLKEQQQHDDMTNKERHEHIDTHHRRERDGQDHFPA